MARSGALRFEYAVQPSPPMASLRHFLSAKKNSSPARAAAYSSSSDNIFYGPRLRQNSPRSLSANHRCHRLRLRRHRPRALRRSRVRRRRPRHLARRKAPQAQVPLRRHRHLFLRQSGRRSSPLSQTQSTRRIRKHRRQHLEPQPLRTPYPDSRPRPRLAVHRNPRFPDRRFQLYTNH